jgi:hypothetical protein
MAMLMGDPKVHENCQMLGAVKAQSPTGANLGSGEIEKPPEPVKRSTDRASNR